MAAVVSVICCLADQLVPTKRPLISSTALESSLQISLTLKSQEPGQKSDSANHRVSFENLFFSFDLESEMKFHLLKKLKILPPFSFGSQTTLRALD